MVTIRNGTSSTDVIVAGKTPIEVEILIQFEDEQEIWVSARHEKTQLQCNECDILELTINYLRMKITINITKRQTMPANNRYVCVRT